MKRTRIKYNGVGAGTAGGHNWRGKAVQPAQRGGTAGTAGGTAGTTGGTDGTAGGTVGTAGGTAGTEGRHSRHSGGGALRAQRGGHIGHSGQLKETHLDDVDDDIEVFWRGRAVLEIRKGRL